MKRIYSQLIKGLIKRINIVMAGLLALLGFSCQRVEVLIPMYGAPMRMYRVMGTVVDRETQRPIPGIEVKVMINDYPFVPPYARWIDKTPANGTFKITYISDDDFKAQGFPIIITDIDGQTNGSYKADTIYINKKDAVKAAPSEELYYDEHIAAVTIELEADTENNNH